MKFLAIFLLCAGVMSADIIYSNTTNDTFTDFNMQANQAGATEIGDQVGFAGTSRYLDAASFVLFNESLDDTTANVTLNLYGVDVSDPSNPAAGSLLGSYTLQSFDIGNGGTSGDEATVSFTIPSLLVPDNLIWTLGFTNIDSSDPGAASEIGLEIVDPPTVGSSTAPNYWFNDGSGLTLSTDPVQSDVNTFGAEFDATADAETTTPEPATPLLFLSAAGLMFYRRRRA